MEVKFYDYEEDGFHEVEIKAYGENFVRLVMSYVVCFTCFSKMNKMDVLCEGYLCCWTMKESYVEDGNMEDCVVVSRRS